MPIHTFAIGPLDTNCYVVSRDSDALIVDPGGDRSWGLDTVLQFMERNKLVLRAVLLTHLHFDHFDEVAAKVLPKALTLFSQSEEEAQILRGMGFDDVRVLSGEGIAFDGVRLYRTKCDHGSSNLVTVDVYKDRGLTEKASGVVFESAAETERFYLAGDTIYCQLVVDAVEKFKPGIVAVNAAGAQYPLGHLIIMNQYDVRSLMRRFPTLKVIATHVEGVSHATVNRPMLREFAKANQLDLLFVPNDGEVLEF